MLVVCASVQQREAFVDISAEQRERQTRINFHASVELMQTAVIGMQARGWSRILTIGSINQTRPDAELAIYAALKSAQLNLAINLARQVAAHGVTVNNLSPDLIATARNAWRRVDAAQWQAIQARAPTPWGAPGCPKKWPAPRCCCVPRRAVSSPGLICRPPAGRTCRFGRRRRRTSH